MPYAYLVTPHTSLNKSSPLLFCCSGRSSSRSGVLFSRMGRFSGMDSPLLFIFSISFVTRKWDTFVVSYKSSAVKARRYGPMGQWDVSRNRCPEFSSWRSGHPRVDSAQARAWTQTKVRAHWSEMRVWIRDPSLIEHGPQKHANATCLP